MARRLQLPIPALPSDAVATVQHRFCAPMLASQTAAALLDKAAFRASDAGFVGTEHVLWALFHIDGYSPGIAHWMALQTFGDIEHGKELFRARILQTLDQKGFATSADYDGNTMFKGPADIGLTSSMERVMTVAKQIGGRPVRDESLGTNYDKGMIAPEFIIAAMMVDGVSVAADIISRSSRGGVNCWNLLEAIDVNPASLHSPMAMASLEMTVINRGSSAKVATAWEPESEGLPAICDGGWCTAPRPYANWLVPGRVMIGETPGGDRDTPSDGVMQSELRQLAEHVDTFVNLRGEWAPMSSFVSRCYPRQLQDARLDADVLFFPIGDFRTTHEDDVVAVVLELRRRLRRGERLYIHCRSGHGRTGMICVPLIASLYNMSADESRDFVQRAHDIGRNGGRDKGWPLPETSDQWALVVSVNDRVRQAVLSATGDSR